MPVQLSSQELQFGKSMTRGRVDALVVTCPHQNETVSLLNDRGEDAKVTVQSKPGGCGWTIENFPEMSHVLVYGTTGAATVKVDGNVLPNATTLAESGSTPGGWEADVAGNRLIIRLPSLQGEQSQLTREIEVDLEPGKNMAS
jgi:hypothetical protein